MYVDLRDILFAMVDAFNAAVLVASGSRIDLVSGDSDARETAAVEARTQTEQRTLAAQQEAAEARANAEAAIETARGIAESTRLRGEALRANPEIIQQIYAERSQGLCPPGTDTCIIGQGAWGLVPGKE